MSFDRNRFGDSLGLDRVRERLDDFYAYAFLPPSVTRESLSEDDDTDADEEASTGEGDVDEHSTSGAVSEADVGESDFGEFQFGPWLDEGAEAGPKKPPAEPRVVTGTIDASAATASPTVDEGGFDFVAWLEIDGAVETIEEESDLEPVDEVDLEGFAFAEWLAAGEDFEPIDLGGAGEQESVGQPTVHRPSIGWSSLRPGIHPAKVATYAMFLAVVVLAALSVVGQLPALGPSAGL